MPFAIGNTTELSGSAIAFKSNTLTMVVDGEAAAAVPKASKHQSFLFSKRLLTRHSSSLIVTK